MKRSFRCVAKVLIYIVVRLFAIFRSLPFESRRTDVHPSNVIEHNSDFHSPSGTETVTEEDHIHPCVERLQKVEQILEELKNKPAQIPKEKDQMLLHSLERIKSVEFDLDKTKKVSHFNFLTPVRSLSIIDLNFFCLLTLNSFSYRYYMPQ